MFKSYVALIDRANKNADYCVCFPDFPGCVFSGKTVDDALANAREGLLFHIDGLLETGETLPEPSKLDNIVAGLNNSKVSVSMVRIMLPSKEIKRINICMDKGLIAAIDRAARKIHCNRSEFLTNLARLALA